MRESLEVDDQDLWRPVDLHLFGRNDVIFATIAIPLVVARKGLFDHEVVEAIVKRYLRVRGRVHDGGLLTVDVLDRGLLDHLELGWRIAPPLDDQDQITLIGLSDYVEQGFTIGRILEVAIVFVLDFAELALVTVVEEHA